jgi:hypothetical protein
VTGRHAKGVDVDEQVKGEPADPGLPTPVFDLWWKGGTKVEWACIAKSTANLDYLADFLEKRLDTTRAKDVKYAVLPSGMSPTDPLAAPYVRRVIKGPGRRRWSWRKGDVQRAREAILKTGAPATPGAMAVALLRDRALQGEPAVR